MDQTACVINDLHQVKFEDVFTLKHRPTQWLSLEEK